MPTKTIKITSPAAYLAASGVFVITIVLVFFAAKWCLANAAALAADRKEVAEYAVSLSPSDPRTHFSAAVLLEKTFLPDDYERSLTEYQAAAALSPSNYLIWIEYGRSLDRHGDEQAAETALRRAFELAPNYASAKWALGNYLLRQGKVDEGFAQLRDAVNSNEKLADATVQSAYAWFDGNIEDVRASLGDSAVVEASLIKLLVREKRLDDAFEIWDTVPKGSDPVREASNQLLALLIEDKRFRQAYDVYAAGRGASAGEPGTITNGGFEEDIKTQNGSVFDWQIGDSGKVQAAIIEGKAHSGVRSFRLLYAVTEEKDFRGLSQYAAVEPGKRYSFEAYYKADLSTSVPLKWEIVDAAGGGVIAATESLKNAEEWSRIVSDFAVPASCEAVIIRLAREKCPGVICPISGSIFFDDVTVHAR